MKALSFLVLLICLTSCGLPRQYGRSLTIHESRRRGVFVCEYEVSPNPYVINDSLKLKVMDVWLEKQWRHATNPNQTDIQHGYQLCVSVSEESLKNYRLTWRIGDHRNRYFGRGYHSLIYARFDHMPREEEEFLVQEGFDLNPDRENKVVLGKFVVRKKQKKE